MSTADSATALKFFDQGTQAFEAEAGLTINEPGTYAVKAATELAVVELIKEGQRKGVWEYKADPIAVIIPPKEEKKTPVISSEIKKESKAEDKKEVVVQPQAVPEAKEEVKVEQKKEEAPKADTKPSESNSLKTSPLPLFGERKLKENSFLYAGENEAGTKKWWFPKGSVVSVRQLGTEGWWRVMITDGSERGGWIRSDKLE
jgi:hypothetical protein